MTETTTLVESASWQAVVVDPAKAAEFTAAVDAGVDPTLAAAEVWPRPDIKVILSTCDDGHGQFVVGWDHCSRCNKGVSACACSNGPTPPQWVTRWKPTEHVATTATGKTAGESLATGAMAASETVESDGSTPVGRNGSSSSSPPAKSASGGTQVVGGEVWPDDMTPEDIAGAKARRAREAAEAKA